MKTIAVICIFAKHPIIDAVHGYTHLPLRSGRPNAYKQIQPRSFVDVLDELQNFYKPKSLQSASPFVKTIPPYSSSYPVSPFQAKPLTFGLQSITKQSSIKFNSYQKFMTFAVRIIFIVSSVKLFCIFCKAIALT